MSADETRLVKVVINADAPPATPELDQEQRVAVFELVEEHQFDVSGVTGDVELHLERSRGAFDFSVKEPGASEAKASFALPTSAFDSLIRDYHAICAAYTDAVRSLPVNRIEAIDEGRRAIHVAAGEELVTALSPFAALDAATGRRLFSLIATIP